MEIYIKGTGNISPQDTISGKLPLEPKIHQTEYLKCIEPNYKEFLNPILARRMGRVIKMGVTAAKICLKNAAVEKPGAIITGTGFGCIEDTENFLISMIENEEKFLPPASFIQSTHNTIGAQIALELKCHEYNITFVHRGLSFESALTDALMLIRENSADDVLLGGIDEITTNYFQITSRLGLWKKENNHLDLVSSVTNGSYAGEGAAFFILSGQPSENDYAKIISVSTFIEPKAVSEVENKIHAFLASCDKKISEIDTVLYGFSGDNATDVIYHHLDNNLFKNSNSLYYKHLCGEYFTSTAFATWLASNILKERQIPDYVQFRPNTHKTTANILIYNHFKNIDHSLILLSGC